MARPRTGWLGVALGWCLTAGAVAPAGAPPPAEVEGAVYVVVEPAGPWVAERWPAVISLVAPAEVATERDSLGKFTAKRGALLTILASADEARLDATLQALGQHYPLLPGRAILVARGATDDWARELALRRSDLFAGYVAIDAPVTDATVPTPGRTDLKVCLLVLAEERLAANEALAAALRRKAIPCALQRVAPADLPRYLAAGLDELLPPSPTRTEVLDPVTAARLRASEGWEFVYDPYFLAVARPAGEPDGLRLEVATGLLGKRSFEGYVRSTAQTLQGRGIDLLESTAVTTPDPDAELKAHAFYFIDRRQADTELAVYWVLVAKGARIVSFRCVAPRAELVRRFDQIRELALSVGFEEPAPAAP